MSRAAVDGTMMSRFEGEIDDSVKHGIVTLMKTIRQIRQEWPEAERLLAVEKEILIARDGKPIAKLRRLEEVPTPKKKFDPESQRLKRERIFGEGVTVNWVDEFRESRADREL